MQLDSLRLAELIESEEEEWVVVLYDKVSHEWGEPECSILIDDFFDERFTFLIGGHRLEGIAVDIFLPGESQAAEMDGELNEVMQSGTPIRRQWLQGDEFPLGRYVFDVHIDGEIFHFAWNRSDHAMNTVSLSCLGREEESGAASSAAVAEDAAASAEAALEEASEVELAEPGDETAGITELDNDELVAIFDEQCVVGLDASDDDSFNLFISAIDRGDLAIDVFLPGEDEPFKSDASAEHSLSLGESESVQSDWAESADFPLGKYLFHVHINDNLHQFHWERHDAAGRTFVLQCFHAVVADDDPLKDEEKTYIPETPCLIWTEAWDVDLNILVIGENLDAISVDLYFPGEEQPQDKDGIHENEFDDGTPYRVEWIEGSVFPLGLYNIDVTIDGQLYPYQWQREEQSVNTFGVECITVENRPDQTAANRDRLAAD